jgi:cyclase
MVPIRIIPRLEIKNGFLIKGVNFEGLRVLGDPSKFVKCYFDNGADEISYVDVVASLYGTNNLEKFISETVKNIFIPITVGGGIRDINTIEKFLNSGADKVSINSAIVKNLNFLKMAVKKFGSSTINCSIECIKFEKKYYVSTENGRNMTLLKPVDWFRRVQDNGVGEVTISSINNEGLQNGFDLQLYEKISKFIQIPVIAHGGAGNFNHVYDVINSSNISGVSLSSLLHYDTLNFVNNSLNGNKIGNYFFLDNFKKKIFKNNLLKLKKFLKRKKISVRL